MKTTKFKKTKYLLFLLGFILIIQGCDSSDDSNDNNLEGNLGDGETIAQVNGQEFAAAEGNTSGLLITIPETEGFYIFTISSAIALNESGSSRDLLSIGLAGNNVNDLRVGEVWDANSETQAVTGTYAEVRNETSEIIASSELEGTATFTLTAIDRDARILSGEFSFIAQDEFTGDIFTVTNGRFKNVSYFEQ